MNLLHDLKVKAVKAEIVKITKMSVRELENIESGQEHEPLTTRDDTRKQCFLGKYFL